jgi:NADH dehydrogenase
VDAVDLEDQTLTTARTTYAWDYLVLAAGAVTDFHGFDQHLEDVHKLDSLDDARRMRQAFATYADGAEQPHAVVVGGGYTGMQLACNLKYAGRECTPRPKITVVELKDHILPFMPAWVRDYMCRRAGQHGIELRPGLSVAEFDGRDVHLSDGTLLKHVFLAWAAGTTRTITRLRGNHEQLDDGRLVVDDCLRVPEHEGAFVAGDCAAIRSHGSYLRKAVNFSLGSGRCAGGNIANALRGRRPSTFRPVDLGWVIPFCDVGVGEVLSKYRVRGRVPLSLYCAMCGLRNYNWKNRLYFWRKALRALH